MLSPPAVGPPGQTARFLQGPRAQTSRHPWLPYRVPSQPSPWPHSCAAAAAGSALPSLSALCPRPACRLRAWNQRGSLCASVPVKASAFFPVSLMTLACEPDPPTTQLCIVPWSSTPSLPVFLPLSRIHSFCVMSKQRPLRSEVPSRKLRPREVEILPVSQRAPDVHSMAEAPTLSN